MRRANALHLHLWSRGFRENLQQERSSTVGHRGMAWDSADGVSLVALHLAVWPAPHLLSPLPTASIDALREPGRRAGENH